MARCTAASSSPRRHRSSGVSDGGVSSQAARDPRRHHAAVTQILERAVARGDVEVRPRETGRVARAAAVPETQEQILHQILRGFRRAYKTEHILAQLDVIRLEGGLPAMWRRRRRGGHATLERRKRGADMWREHVTRGTQMLRWRNGHLFTLLCAGSRVESSRPPLIFLSRGDETSVHAASVR